MMKTRKLPMDKRADLLLVLVTAFWGASYYLMDICLEDLEAFNLNAIRFLASSFLLGLIFLDRIRKSETETYKYGVLAGIPLVAVYVGVTYGVKYTSVSNAGFIISLTAAFTPMFEWLFFRKQPNRQLLVILVPCIIGLGLLTLDDHLEFAVGDIFCLLSAAAYSFNLLITEYAVTKTKTDPFSMTVIELFFVGCVMLFLSCIFESPHLPRSGNVWIASLFLALFCTGFAFLIQTTQQKYTKAANVGIIYTFEPVFSALIAFIFAGERLELRSYCGAGLMLLSLVLMELQKANAIPPS